MFMGRCVCVHMCVLSDFSDCSADLLRILKGSGLKSGSDKEKAAQVELWYTIICMKL